MTKFTIWKNMYIQTGIIVLIYETKIIFLPMQGWSDFAVLMADRRVNLQFLEIGYRSLIKYMTVSVKV